MNEGFCQAVDCPARAELNLDIPLADGNIVTILVCKKCISKFKNAFKVEKTVDVSPVRAGHQIIHRGGGELHAK